MFTRTIRILIILLTASWLPASARAAEGTLVVLNKSEATASLFDLASGRVMATVPTGQGPHEVAVSPDGKHALATDYGRREPGSTLTLIDIPQAKVMRTIDLGEYRRPHGVRYLDDRRAVVTAEANQALLVVDTETGKVERAIGTDQDLSHMVALSPDATRAFVANIRSGSVTAIDLKAGKRLGIVETGEGAEGIAVTPGGQEVWVTNRAADTVSVLDAGSLEVLETLETASFPIRIDFTPDGQRALVSCARASAVAVFDTRERREVKRIEMKLKATGDTRGRLFEGSFGDSSVPIGILVLPDGSRAYVAHTQSDRVSVIDLERMEVVDRFESGKEPDGLGYSPLKVER